MSGHEIPVDQAGMSFSGRIARARDIPSLGIPKTQGVGLTHARGIFRFCGSLAIAHFGF
jgi:hypothetical protein